MPTPLCTITTTNPEQTMAAAQRLAGLLRRGDVLGLTGELGAGKTQFVRGLAAGLGMNPHHVTSPTFVIMHEYESAGQPVQTAANDPCALLVHIDAYRLHGPEELAALGWDDQADDWQQQAIVAIEWIERVAAAVGEDWLNVRIEHVPEGRCITFEPHGQWLQRAGQLQRTMKGDYVRTP